MSLDISMLEEVKNAKDNVICKLIEVGMFNTKGEVVLFQEEFMKIYNDTRGVDKGFPTFYLMVDMMDKTFGLGNFTKSSLIDNLCGVLDRGIRLMEERS